MTIPTPLLSVTCVVLALLLTFVVRIQRRNLINRLRDFVTLALFVVGVWWVHDWDPLSNWVVGVLAGLIAVVIRDIRLWAARFRRRCTGALSATMGTTTVLAGLVDVGAATDIPKMREPPLLLVALE